APAFAIMLALSVLYSAYGELPLLRDALYGVGPVVLGIFVAAVYRLGKNAIKDLRSIAIALAAAAPLSGGGGGRPAPPPAWPRRVRRRRDVPLAPCGPARRPRGGDADRRRALRGVRVCRVRRDRELRRALPWIVGPRCLLSQGGCDQLRRGPVDSRLYPGTGG